MSERRRYPFASLLHIAARVIKRVVQKVSFVPIRAYSITYFSSANSVSDRFKMRRQCYVGVHRRLREVTPGCLPTNARSGVAFRLPK